MTADELSKLLDELGQRLGPAGAHVFDLAVRQQYINGWVSVMFCLIAGAFFVGGVLLLWRADDTSYRWLAGMMASFGGGIVFAIAIVTLLISGVPDLLNPEYAAIKDLLGSLPR